MTDHEQDIDNAALAAPSETIATDADDDPVVLFPCHPWEDCPALHLDVCRAYWELDDTGAWVSRARDIASRFQLPHVRAVLELVRTHSTWADPRAGDCPACGLPILEATSREGADSFRRASARSWKIMVTECRRPECRAQREQAKKVAAERAAAERRTAAGDRIDRAFAEGKYRGLNPLELRYLIALHKTMNYEKARRAVGLSTRSADTIERQLDEIGLISIEQNMIADESVARPLMSLAPKLAILPLIPAPPAREVYRTLASKHAFVFPEVSVAAFIDLSAVEHLFTERWHRPYALACRVDFLVCDEETRPLFAVEYQGGAHFESENREKDALKRAIIEAAGLPLHDIRWEDLRSLRDDLPSASELKSSTDVPPR